MRKLTDAQHRTLLAMVLGDGTLNYWDWLRDEARDTDTQIPPLARYNADRTINVLLARGYIERDPAVGYRITTQGREICGPPVHYHVIRHVPIGP